MIQRLVNPLKLLEKSSHFLLGPRAVGKSALIKDRLKNSSVAQRQQTDYIDLLDSRLYLRLKSDPSLLRDIARKKFIVIDEIQRIPDLLNEVHYMIENQGRRFLLTGSSARKLKGAGVNLLAGRAFMARLFPLTWRELKSRFHLNCYLRFGGLPLACLKPDSEEYLHNYVDTYLKEEIQAEALTRNLPNYVRFLQSAALNNGCLLNYTKIASDAGLSPNTVRDYYQILEDTLIGFSVPPWTKSAKRKAVQTAKFYFFDPGVVRALRESREPAGIIGPAFEQFIACEIRAALSYCNARLPLRYWRSKSGFEADFVIGDDVALEVKVGRKASPRDQKSLCALKEERSWKRLLLVSQDPLEMKFRNGVQHLHWKSFLTRLWKGKYF